MEELIGIAIAEDGGLKKYLHEAVILLRSIRSGLAEILEDALNGDPAALKILSGKQDMFEKTLIRAFEAEDRFNAWYAKEHGNDADGQIDFDAIREEIWCRLARIRDCG